MVAPLSRDVVYSATKYKQWKVHSSVWSWGEDGTGYSTWLLQHLSGAQDLSIGRVGEFMQHPPWPVRHPLHWEQWHYSWNPLCLVCCHHCRTGTSCHRSAYQSKYLSLLARSAENSLRMLVNSPPILFVCDGGYKDKGSAPQVWLKRDARWVIGTD